MNYSQIIALINGIADEKDSSIATGIKSVKINTAQTGLVFTTNDNKDIEIIIPTHTHSNLATILEKLTLDTNGDLLFDGEKLGTGYDDTQIKVDLDSKMDKITIDTDPTTNSTNLITSGGVKSQIDYLNTNKLESSNIIAGSNISLSTSGNDITINSTGGSGLSLIEWCQNTDYQVADYVTNDYKLYKCILEHTSGTEFDSSKWDFVLGNTEEESEKNIYSSVETTIGEWQGKKLYRTTLDIGVLPNGVEKDIPLSIDGLTKIISYSGVAENSEGNVINLLMNSQAIGKSIEFSVNKTQIKITTNSDYSSYSGYLWIEYIK